MSKWHPEYIFEAIISAPSVFLDSLVQGFHKFIVEEREIALNGEFTEEEIEPELDYIRGAGRTANDAVLHEMNELL